MEIKPSPELSDIKPQKLEGFDNVLNQESIGGNAGPNHAAVNGYYKDGEIIFWTGATPKDSVAAPRVIYMALMVSPKVIVEEIKNKRPIPPNLIERIGVEKADEATQAYFAKRAVEHNAYKVLRYLQKGGQRSLIPITEITPDIDKLLEKK